MRYDCRLNLQNKLFDFCKDDSHFFLTKSFDNLKVVEKLLED